MNTLLVKAIKDEEQPDINKLEKNINNLKSQLRQANWKLGWIRFKPKLLRVTWGALFPALLFIISIILISLAIYYNESSSSNALVLWYASIGCMILGSIFIILTLSVTQDVAISSDETSLTRQKEMFKSAIIEVNEAERPILELSFRGSQPPFIMKPDQIENIEYSLELIKAQIAVSPKVYFFVPEGFELPGSRTTKQDNTAGIVSNFVSTGIDMVDCRKGVLMAGDIRIKAPSEKRLYKAYYKVICDSFSGDILPFDINVE